MNTDNDAVSPSLPVSEWLRIADEHFRAGRHAEAEAVCHHILREHPEQPDALLLLGRIAAQIGMYDVAAELISGAIQVAPEFAEAYYNLGNVFRKQGTVQDAEACYRGALTLKPELAEAHNKLGELYVEQGLGNEAIAEFDAAIQHDSNLLDAYRNLGALYAQLGQPFPAWANLSKVVDLDPHDVDAAALLDLSITAIRQQLDQITVACAGLPTRRLVVVLGMHRSGTSAITRGLQALGVALGDNLMPAAADNNEKGFFEDVDVNRLNIALMHALDHDWDALSLIPDSAFERDAVAPFRLAAIELLLSKLGEQPFGLKDPRIGRLLPFWQSIFRVLRLQPLYVIALRHPMSVAESLRRRNGFDAVKSYYLWLEHTIPAILHTRGAPRVVVDYDRLMAAPLAEIKRMATALALPFDPDSDDFREYAGEFLDEKLRHARFDTEALRGSPDVPADLIEAYQIMTLLAQDLASLEEAGIEERFRQMEERLTAMSPALDYIVRLEQQTAHTTQPGPAIIGSNND